MRSDLPPSALHMAFPMQIIADASVAALRGDPETIARQLIRELDAETIQKIANIAYQTNEEHLASFERSANNEILINGRRAGRFWIVGAIPRRRLRPFAPTVVMRGLKLIGDEIIAILKL